MEMAEKLEQEFIALSFKTGKNQLNEKQADKLLQKYQQQVREEGGAEIGENDDGIEEETKENSMESRVLEEFINENAKNNVCKEYKLFDVVTAKNPSQILRYSQQQNLVQNPLWVSDKHKPAEVPVCPKCGGQRIFEFQLTP